MAEALLSASLQVLFDRMASRDFISLFSGRKDGDKLLRKLKVNLGALQAVVNDAEDKQFTSPTVKDWLDGLKDVAYHADDLLDQIATQALQSKLKAAESSQSQGSMNQVWDTVSNSFTFPFNEGIESSIQEIIDTLDDFVKQKDILGLKGYVGRKQSQRQQTTSLVDETGVYGRDDEKEKIINLLLSDELASNHGIPVIPIVGMGGVGKTTLAQLVYNDPEVVQKFDIKAWVCVSDEFDVSITTKKIVEAVSAPSKNTTNLNSLQTTLKEGLMGKKFLIILDDIWNENYSDWDLLKGPFRFGAPKSRIIITTRNESVARIMRSVPSHHLEQLSFEDCRSLFVKHAFENGNYTAHPNLETIGNEIVKKCQGLPLAVKSLGGLLRGKLDIEEWEDILKSEIWDLGCEILPALRLSYHYLPSHLKRCFAYCSIFLKDHKFAKEKLVQLWIDEGFVQQQTKRNKPMEDEGSNYFSELLSRSFFQRLSGTDSSFVMHDLIHDLAEFVSREFCFRLEDDHDNARDLSKVRHFSYVQAMYDAIEKLNVVNEAKYLRTFTSFSTSHLAPILLYGSNILSKKVLRDILPHLRCLRVLSLSGYIIFELPQRIDNLVHLRHLDLSSTRLKRLPDSVSTLCNLQTLNLSYCSSLIELPTKFGKLVNLRYLNVASTRLSKLPVDMGKLINLRNLDISKSWQMPMPTPETSSLIEEMPMQMSSLVGLQNLTHFVVGKDNGSRISELKTLNHLRGKLSILKLQNVVNSRDALEANFKDKKHLEELELEWSGYSTHDSQNESDVLDNLKPHTNLKYVTIYGFGGRRLPDWLGDVSFSNIVRVNLSDCGYCDSLPPLGHLPSLKHLFIREMKEVKKVGEEFYGDASLIKPFQSLETLSFKNMAGWEEWHAFGGGESFSCLLEISLFCCPNLTGELPNHFPCLRTLNISECRRLEFDQAGLLLQHMSSLQKLEISDIPNLTQLPPEFQNLCSLQELKISIMPNLTQLPLELKQLHSLQKLKISNMPNLTQLPSELKQLHSLQELIISDMPNLKDLPPELWRLKKLESLWIKECSSLVSFPDFALPPMLKTLEISCCDAVESLQEGTMRFNKCLEDIVISECSSLVSFPIGGTVPDTLKKIRISGCEKLEFHIMFKEEMEPCSTSIEHLEILKSCDSLRSLPMGFFQKLRCLIIYKCKNFETLSLNPDVGLQNLTEIYIFDCPKMVSFLHGGLPAPNLKYLQVVDCEKLKSLPQRMDTLLSSLESLEIVRCPEVESFPDGGLPANIRKLKIDYCEKLMKRRMGWGLQRLSSLEQFTISGDYEEDVLESFPEEWVLPPTLATLEVHSFPNLKSLNHEGLQHLTSLTSLHIWGCPKLLSLPEEGLPNSLSFLCISSCPLLKERYQGQKWKHWSTIARIRHIELDGKDIVNLE